MADLKIGTTIGGQTLWTQGNLPLVPSGDRVLYKAFRIYTEADKPTANDVGAYAKSETYTRQEVDQLGKLRVLDLRNTNYTPAEYPQQMLSTFFNTSEVAGALPTTAAWYSGINVKGWSNGYCSWQIASLSNAGSSNNKLWFRTSQSDTTWNAWGRVYTEFDKPTPADIGAVNKAGDTMTGTLTLTASAPQLKLVNANNYISASGNNIYVAANNTDGKVILEGKANPLVRLNLSSGSRDYTIYHQGFKPTAAELNVPANNVTTVGGQDWNNLTSAGSYTVSGMTGANKPTINGAPAVYGYGTLFVQNTGSEICQIYITDHNKMYIRDKFSTNSWGTWSAVSNDESVDIRTSVDLNDYSMGGTFNMYKGSGVTFTNAPADFDYGTLQVIGRGQVGGSFVTQILTWRSDGRQMIRTRNDTGYAWTGWKKIYSEAQKPTPADINAVNRDQVNFAQTGTWAGVIGKIPTVGNNGVMEVGKYIDFHNTNSTNDYDVRLDADSSLNVRTLYGNVSIGARNESFCHIYTDRSRFAFDKCLNVFSGYGIAVENSDSPRIELHRPGQIAYTMAAAGNNSFELWNSNGAGGWIKTLIRVNASDGYFWNSGNGDFNDVYIRSDKRLKSNVKLTTDHLNKIMQLKPVVYDKKMTLDAETTVRELGLIAQDVEEVIPLAVGTGTDEHQLKALKPYALIATLIGAVKEQQKQIEQLKAMIEAR